MKLYAGTTEQFRVDARIHRIAEKLRAEYTTEIGHRRAPSEVASWQNSFMALSMLVDQAGASATRSCLQCSRSDSARSLGLRPASARNTATTSWARLSQSAENVFARGSEKM